MRSFKIYDFTLSAGGAMPLLVEGGYFKIYSCTGVLSVSIDGGSTIGPINTGQGMKTEFKRLTIVDQSGAANVGKIIVASNEFVDGRISGEVSVIDGSKSRTKAGNSFIGGFYSTALAANLSMVQLFNPAASGKNLVLSQVEMSAKALCGFWISWYNAGLTTPQGTIANKFIGLAGNVGVIRTQQNATLLGTTLLYYHVLASSPQILRFSDPMVVPPGFGVHVSSDTVNIEVAGSFEWYEEAV